jgi:methyl-accepting chemotaxis protein
VVSIAVGIGLVAGFAFMGFLKILPKFFGMRGTGREELLSVVLNNMTQGVVMFDDKERLVVCNDRYLEMYDMPRSIIKPGATLTQVIEARSRGSLGIDHNVYRQDILKSVSRGDVQSRIVESPDGRSISVVNRAIKGTRYWIGIHDDITERIHAERKNAALSEQERRRLAIEKEILTFRENVASVLETVCRSAAGLKSIAVTLSGASARTSEQASGAVQSSNDAAAHMTASASAAEELIASIAEVGRQLGQAAGLVNTSVTEAHAADERMTALTQSVEEIGAIVNLIRNIAGQTNLLALNATIEAARAGEAGRGFAVVASEVKALAVQTARATEQIASQIDAVQTSTRFAVDAMRRNTERMHEIDGCTSTVARSLDQQDHATGEIAQNAASAAGGAKAVVTSLADVAGAVDETQRAAAGVLEASDSVEAAAAGLQARIESFLDRVAV